MDKIEVGKRYYLRPKEGPLLRGRVFGFAGENVLVKLDDSQGAFLCHSKHVVAEDTEKVGWFKRFFLDYA